MARPSGLPIWATTAGVTDLIEPATGKKETGWRKVSGIPEKPPYQEFNWWQNLTYLWLEYWADLTDDEFTQLKNIDAVTISNTQWGYLGALDQSLAVASAVEFASVSVASADVDTIDEKTLDAGVTIETVLVKDGNVTIPGDLTVNGTTFTSNTETVLIEDNLLVINNGEVGAGVTAGVAGLEVDRGSETNYQLVFRESDDVFAIGEAGSLQAVATREDTPTDRSVPVWNDAAKRFDSAPVTIQTNGSTRFDISGSAGSVFSGTNAQVIISARDTGAAQPYLAAYRDNNGAGFLIESRTTDANTSGDMLFRVLENDGTDYETASGSGFLWQRNTTQLMSLGRGGNLVLGSASNSDISTILYSRNADGDSNSYGLLLSQGGTISWGMGIDSTNNKAYDRVSPGLDKEFYVGATMVGQYDSDGQWVIGPSGTNTNTNTIWGSVAHRRNYAGTGGQYFTFYDGASDVCGAITINAVANTTTFVTSSDARMKNDLGEFSAFEYLERFDVKKYQWKNISEGVPEVGVFAQELIEVCPWIAVYLEESDKYMVDYGKLAPLAVKAAVELNDRVERLEKLIAS